LKLIPLDKGKRSARTRIQPTALDRLIEDYLSSCRARGLSPNTVDQSYAYPLKGILLPWAQRNQIEDVSGLDRRALDQLSSELLEQGGARGRPLSRYSVHAYMRAVNQFLSWSLAEGEAVEAKAQLPRLPKTLVDVLSREEIDRLEDAARTERDKLIVRLLADTGIRVGELIKLRTTDLIERDRKQFILVRGKGSRERLVPVPRLHRRLQRLARGRPAQTSSDLLFLGLKRRAGAEEVEPLTPSGVQQMVRNTARMAGIEKRVHPHLLRHSFATWQLSRGMNPIQLADILGHSSLVMIHKVYAHLSPGDAYDAMVRTLVSED